MATEPAVRVHQDDFPVIMVSPSGAQRTQVGGYPEPHPFEFAHWSCLAARHLRVEQDRKPERVFQAVGLPGKHFPLMAAPSYQADCDKDWSTY